MAKVYISSTVADLETERQAVIAWLVAAGHQPIHSYRPNSETVRDSCLDDVQRCDLFVLILGHRYGVQPSDGNPTGLSITHLEYRHAKGKPRIALIRTNIPDVATSDIGDPEKLHCILKFREEVQKEVRPAEFHEGQGLIQALSTGIQDALDNIARSDTNAPTQEGASADVRAMMTKTIAEQAQAISRLSFQLERKNIENEALRQRLTERQTQSDQNYLEPSHG